MSSAGIAVGLKRGFIVTKRAKKATPVTRKGRLGEKLKLIRGVVREVVGWAPYEKRIMEILKGGGNNPNKRAWRFAKKRLGTHRRAKRKVTEMADVINKSKQAEAAAKAAAKAAEKQ